MSGHNTGPMAHIVDLQGQQMTPTPSWPMAHIVGVIGTSVTLAGLIVTASVGYGILLNRVATLEIRADAIVPRREHEQVWQQQNQRLTAIEAAVHRIEDKLGTTGRL